MTQRITWSTSVKFITWGCIILIIVAAISTFIGAARTAQGSWAYAAGALLLFILLFTYLFSPAYLEMDDEYLTVYKVVGKKRIRLNDIKETHLYVRSMGNIRAFGSGGLFGYFGKFHNYTFGHYTAYVGDYSKAFYIVLKNGKKYLLSCKDREAFLDELGKHITIEKE